MEEISHLFDGPEYSFQSRPDDPIPDSCAGVYTIWEGERFLYVGIAGRDLTKPSKSKVRGLKQRLRTHWKGGLGGDQFAVYVFERITAPQLKPSQLKAMGKGELTLIELNQDYIQNRLSFRFIETPNYARAMKIEKLLKKGEFQNRPKPFLNPN